MTKTDKQIVDEIIATEWTAASCTIYTARNNTEALAVLTTFVDGNLDAGHFPSDAEIELAKRLCAFPAMLKALRKAAPWLGKLIADGGHLNSVAPNDAIGTLQRVEAAIAQAEGVEGGAE